MIGVDGDLATWDEVPADHRRPRPAPDPAAPEKACGCHPAMPDITVPGGRECLGCGWGYTVTFTLPKGPPA